MEDLKDVVLFFEKYWKYPMAKIILAVISILFPGLLGNIFIYIPDDKWLLRILFIFGGLILAYFGVKDLKISLKGKNTKKTHRLGILIKFIIFLLFIMFSCWAIISTLSDASIDLQNWLCFKPTATVTVVPTITSTPIYKTIQDLPTCISKDKNFPCKYFTLGENPKDIADAYYSHRTELAGRIMELYRDESGTIPEFKENKMIIIPEDNRKQDLDYYEFYFQLLDYPISQCQSINSLQTPCWCISNGESYKELANGYSTIIKSSCIPGANKTEWSKADGGLIPKTIEPGTMIVLPVCQ